MRITKRQLRRIIKEEKTKVLAEGRNPALRDALMNAYEYVYDEQTLQGADPSVAQDRASDAVMVEVEAWLDAVGIPKTYVGMS